MDSASSYHLTQDSYPPGTRQHISMPPSTPPVHLPGFTFEPAIPYTSAPGRLQTLDLWSRPSPSSSASPSPSTTNPDLWILLLHGGAWRDPEISSLPFALPTLSALLSSSSTTTSSTISTSRHDAVSATTPASPADAIAGAEAEADVLSRIHAIASINYRLSPYTEHPRDPSKPDDPQRNVVHPGHVEDVCAAVEWLGRKRGMRQGRWVGVGHSCGGGMWAQVVGRVGSWESERTEGQGVDGRSGSTTASTTITLTATATATATATRVEVSQGQEEGPGKERGAAPTSLHPTALILISAITHLPLLLTNHSPPQTPEPISRIYRSIVEGAFGSDPRKWLDASPVSGQFSGKVWGKGRLVVLAHSTQDELVEGEQRSVMARRLREEGWVDEEGDAQRIGNEEYSGDQEGSGKAKKNTEKRVMLLRNLSGGHDEIWQEGGQVARLIGEVVRRLTLKS